MAESDKIYEERLKEMASSQVLINFRRDFQTPMNFFDDQPVPHNGVICYGGCFSNHFTD